MLSFFCAKESLPLYPFLLYCMTSMVLLFVKPARFRDSAFVRIGIFSGVLIAAEYWLVFQFALRAYPGLASHLLVLAAFLPWGIWQFLGLLFGKYRVWILGGAIVILLVSAGWSETVFRWAVSPACGVRLLGRWLPTSPPRST